MFNKVEKQRRALAIRSGRSRFHWANDEQLHTLIEMNEWTVWKRWSGLLPGEQPEVLSG